MNHFARSLVTVALVLLGLGACSTPPPVPDDHYYRLADSAKAKPLSEPALKGVLLVDTPSAAGVRRSRKMIYSDDVAHLRFKQYHYHHWEDNPPRLIQQYLTEYLASSGYANKVIDQRKGGYQYILESRIERFDRLLTSADASVRIAIEVWLMDRHEPNRVLMHRQYEENVVANSMTIESTVVAFSSGLDRIGQRLLDDLGKVDP